jgi:hypothetical protein
LSHRYRMMVSFQRPCYFNHAVAIGSDQELDRVGLSRSCVGTHPTRITTIAAVAEFIHRDYCLHISRAQAGVVICCRGLREKQGTGHVLFYKPACSPSVSSILVPQGSVRNASAILSCGIGR